MAEHLHRFALAVLAAAGVLYLWPLAVAGGDGPQAMYLQWLLGLLGASLLAAVPLPKLRAPALGAAILSKMALLGVAAQQAQPAAGGSDLALLLALLAAAAILGREALQEARWNGVLPLRREG
jgi:hypothetical protein